MDIIANIAPARGCAELLTSCAMAQLTEIESGWLLSLVFHTENRCLVGGWVTDKPALDRLEHPLRDRLQSLLSRLSQDESMTSDANRQLYRGAQSLVPKAKHNVAGQIVLSCRQLNLAKDMLGDNLSKRLQVSLVAHACSLSEGNFRRGFRTCTGLSPLRWRQEKRLEFCRARLLETDMPLSQVAQDAGFKVQSQFSRLFVRYTGISPSQWRRIFQSASRLALLNSDTEVVTRDLCHEFA